MKAIFLTGIIVVTQVYGRSFKIDYDNDTFVKDGEPFSYVSGSIHYSRVPAFYWKDRLQRMYAAGLNAIQTYVPWNVHEPEKGRFDFSGQQDIVQFLQLVNDTGLLAIVRGGPYICGEWEFGGFPPWLLKDNSSIVLRSMDSAYIKAVDAYMGVLLPKLKPLLYENGGPIILTQLENEYGSFFTCDHNYTAHLRDLFRAHLGDNVVLFTTDGAGLGYLKCGAVEGVYATVDFGPGNASSGFAPMRQWNPKGPLVNSEFYTGWLDHWGQPHSTGSTDNIVKTLTEILQMKANVNFYMFEGGTNFAFMNGANAPLQPVPTSYDYDSPLTEAGDITSKYMAIRETIKKFRTIPDVPIPKSTAKAAYGTLNMMFLASLFDTAEIISDGKPMKSQYPLTMEQVGQNYGFILYRTILKMNASGEQLKIPGLHDRAHVLLDGEPIGLLYVNEAVTLNLVARSGQQLDLIVENMGRVNYGREMIGQLKGIAGNVTVGGQNLTDWTIYRLNVTKCFDKLNELSNLQPSSNSNRLNPAFYAGAFTVKEVEDTFISMPGWFKGQLLINGYNLGRYWPVKGPQLTLYVPKSVLLPSPQPNYVILVELDYAPCDNTIMIGSHVSNVIPGINRLNKVSGSMIEMDQNNCKVVFTDKYIINGTTSGLEVATYSRV